MKNRFRKGRGQITAAKGNCAAAGGSGRQGFPGRRALLPAALVMPLLWALFASPSWAAPGPCVVDPAGVVTCSGDQSQGIASGTDFTTPPVATLQVNSLTGAIAPASGTSGINFSNSTGSGVAVLSGTAQQSVVITTQGDNAPGIRAASTGSSPGSALLPGLGVLVPTGSSGSAGPVSVESHSTITTGGANSHGIAARNGIGTYDASVVSSLQGFDPDNVTISLTSVSGDSDNIGSQVAGNNGGLFTLDGDGTWSFDPDALSTSLAAGQTIITTIAYQVNLTSSSGSTPSTGTLAVSVTKANDGTITTSPAIYFSSLGVYSDTAGATPLWPNLQGYVNNLLADAGVGSAGESTSVNNAGAIVTHGGASYGIHARGEGGNGATGTSGSFWNAWLVPTPGEKGSNGGSIAATHNGSILTTGAASSGIVAESQGGTGGTGGSGSLWQQNGAQGGTGGTGGGIAINGSGSIHTTGDSASAILAQSAGGAGGPGGAGDTAGVGGAGGYGGKGGTVTVDGNWNITTEGDRAHGIWAKSLGGSAGAGGSGGWLVSQPGAGGDASDGGSVTVASGGALTTGGDHSYGIYAQSIGGAGGSGTSSFGLFWSYGGDGGSGGSGGAVSATNKSGGSIVTLGASSHAIFAQSIGGGGGNGEGSASLLVSMGGTGGSGGNGGAVGVTNEGDLETSGESARGIFAQSIGGGGGNNGVSVSLLAIGGQATVGSDGGAVTVENTGTIATTGNNSDALFAQSVGGGGGTGGSAVGAISVGGFGQGGGAGSTITVTNEGGIGTEGNNSRGIFAQSVGGGGGSGSGSVGVVAVGGSGQGGGPAGSVTVTNDGSITTQGDFSDGIFAQSVGGGGGTAIGNQFNNAVIGAISIGASGTGGGSGSSVTVNSSDQIRTHGDYSHGIYAQSVGGGGGTANATLSDIVSVGGSGGSGGSGGGVTVTNSGRITTEGSGSDGIFAQSVGGGGGGSGYSISLAVNVGGAGSASGAGGAIAVTNEGEIATEGDLSRGIFAQSVGGGGGSIYTDDGSIDLGNASFDAGLLVSIGSQTTTTGNGGNVTATNSGSIATAGESSDGVYAQSVGGSGGSGSFVIGLVPVAVNTNVGKDGGGQGGNVIVANSGSIITGEESSNGIFAQSVGGGGGDGRFSMGMISLNYDSVVGKAGNSALGGNGGNVTVTNSGSIATEEESSRGIFAQSVGGTGGTGISALSGSLGVQFSSTVAIGGQAGNGGVGGAVSVTSSGDITTTGDKSDAILAQSVGGGGGEGGTSLAATAMAGLADAIHSVGLTSTISLGGKGGAGGAGGTVTTDSSGRIATSGAYSRGILAQSVGGGGGAGGASLNITTSLNASSSANVGIGGAGGMGGAGNTVNATNSGMVLTEGASSDAIIAQSVGGGGGSGGYSLLMTIDRSIQLPSIPGTDEIPKFEAQGTVTSSIGGSGGSGGAGGAASVLNSAAGTVATTGDRSSGILAQSVGGGGGLGGTSMLYSSSVTLLSAEVPSSWKDLIPSPSVAVSVTSSIGGSGGSGGAGGAASAVNEGRLATTGERSHAMLAQSVGGGGGAGGDAVSISSEDTLLTATVSVSPEVSVDYTSSVGGSGGTGGAGGGVTASNSGAIATGGDNAFGIYAQSVGGGGGTGGASISSSNRRDLLTLGTSPSLDIGVDSSLGGTGGTGGTGGAVTVTDTGSVETFGAGSHAVFAQSVGGGGGTGGARIDGSTEQSLLTLSPPELSISYSESIGGTGGTGGAGGAVTVTGSGSVLTREDNAYGVFAQSVGGGGGNGGAIISASTEQNLLTASLGSMDIGVTSSMGGNGGAGGAGGAASVTGSKDVTTLGDTSHAIFAQSVGGGGGNGGAIISAGTTQGIMAAAPLELSIGYTSTIGGKAGTGGAGGAVTVTSDGVLYTEGNMSYAIFAQSVGGGGGNGGAVIETDVEQTLLSPLLPAGEITVSSTLGGSGGTGGTGGAVTVANNGALYTLGNMSYGVLAQSVGGGGGNGGSYITSHTGQSLLTLTTATMEISYASIVGGSGGSGGQGGEVTAGNTGTIFTAGAGSYGVLAQSVGGGGGNGGAYIDLAVEKSILSNAPPESNITYSSSVGGSGSAAGNGGSVTATNTGTIVTEGADSDALFAQSVGGGGGAGGSHVSLTSDQTILTIASNSEEISYSSTVGGSGAAGGNGGNVTVANSGDIATQGVRSRGIFAQSVGGGGGAGGDTVNVEIEQNVLTASSQQLSVYRISSDSSLGGSASGGGAGGAVGVTNSGLVYTTNDFSKGVVAQSVGGGGGAGGMIVSAALNYSSLNGPAPREFANDVSATIGGAGGAGGSGGAVNVVNTGDIATTGAFSTAVLAQSVGGGGGLAEHGLSAVMTISGSPIGSMISRDDLQVEATGAAGSAGNGGGVTVSQSGTLITNGAFSHAILAQSVGGGGGLMEIRNPQGVTTTSFGANMRGVLTSAEQGTFFAGSVGGNGSGGSVTVTKNGNIGTTGNYSHGVFAQSAGGLGAGNVSITNSGNVFAFGSGSDAILAQSLGGSGSGTISITIQDGLVMGGTGTGTGVRILNGSNNILSNYGAISSAAGVMGRAVAGSFGNETVDNFGTITGSIDLGAGTNSFNNMAGAAFNPGPFVNLGAGNTLLNAGTLSPGGPGSFQTTSLTGNYVQTGSGQLRMQIGPNGEHGRLSVDGSVSLDGTLSVTKTPGLYRNGTVYSLLETTGGEISGDFSAILLPQATQFVSFTANQQPNGVNVEAHVPKLTTMAANPTESAIADYLDRISATAEGDLLMILTELQSLSEPQFKSALKSMSPDSLGNSTQAGFNGVRQSIGSVTRRMSTVRAHNGTVEPMRLAFNGSNAELRSLFPKGELSQTQTRSGLWLNGYTQWGDQGGEQGASGFDYRLFGATLGYDRPFSDKVMAGVSLGYSRTTIDIDSHQGDGSIKSLTGSLYGSYFSGSGYVEGALSYGKSRYDNSRPVVVGQLARNADSDHDGDAYSAYVGGGWYYKLGAWDVGPIGSLRYTYLHEEGFVETGADSLNMAIDPRGTGSLVSELGLRAARTFTTSHGTFIAEASGAVSYDFDIDDRVITTSFAGSPGAGFSIAGREVKQFGFIPGLGLTFVHKSGFSTSLKYTGEFREKYRSHGIVGQIRFPF